MKKTIPISISQTLFYIEEDSYAKLDAYLSEIKKYFSTYEDKFEIIQDIESRIREQLIEFSDADKTERIITEAHVDKLITNMGTPKEFAGSEEPHSSTTNTASVENRSPKRLYRNKDKAIIGGVASGMAMYLGVNITLMRVIFIVFTMFHGVGFIIYIILWFVLPVADTATEILEMKGNPMNLDGVKKVIEDKIQEVGGKENMKNNAKNFFEDMRNIIIKVFGKAFKIIGKIIGVCLTIGSVVGVTIASVFLFASIIPMGYSNPDSIFNQFHSLPFYYVFVVLAFIAAVIPFSFMRNIGNVFMGKKLFANTQKAVVVFSIWIASLILIPLLIVSVGNEYVAQVNQNIDATRVVEPRTIQEFSKLSVKNGLKVHVVQGTTTSMEVRGSKTGIERLTIEENEGLLTLENRNVDLNFCFFCHIPRTEIFITTPNVNSLIVENGSDVDMRMNTNRLELDMSNASRVTLTGTATSLDLEQENASRLDAEKFVVTTAHIDLANASQADLNVTKEITGVMSNASRIIQHGAGVDKVKKNNSSRVNREFEGPEGPAAPELTEIN